MNLSPTEIDDSEPPRREDGGRLEAFAALYDRCSGLLYSLALRILGDELESEDLLREVFLEVWEKPGPFAPGAGRTQSLLITLVRNRCIDRLRSRQRYRELSRHPLELPVAASAETGDPEAFVLNKERRALMQAAFKALPGEEREALDLACFSGLTPTEIAGVLQAPPAVIKARIRQGMTRLRAAVESGD